MGLTFNLGRISPSVFTDSSLNVGIGAAPSGSYKLEVTGTAKVSSTLLANGISSIGQEQALTFQRTTGSASDLYSINADSGSAYLYNNTTSNALMTWLEGGNVGIGTTSPQSFGSFAVRLATSVSGSNVSASFSDAANSTFDIRHGVGGSGNVVDLSAQSGILTFSAGSAERMRITSGGNVGIGTTGPSAPLEIVAGSATGTTTQILLTRGLGYGSTQFKQYYNSGSDWGLIINQSTDSGGVKLVKDATSWAANTSDERKKKNFEPSQGLEELMKIEALKYHFEWDDDSIPKRMGFKAQNLLPLIPEMVLTTGDKAPDGSDYLTIIPDYLLPVLVKSIQELNERLNKAGL